jgi:hypothetical protein
MGLLPQLIELRKHIHNQVTAMAFADHESGFFESSQIVNELGPNLCCHGTTAICWIKHRTIAK